MIVPDPLEPLVWMVVPNDVVIAVIFTGTAQLGAAHNTVTAHANTLLRMMDCKFMALLLFLPSLSHDGKAAGL